VDVWFPRSTFGTKIPSVAVQGPVAPCIQWNIRAGIVVPDCAVGAGYPRNIREGVSLR